MKKNNDRFARFNLARFFIKPVLRLTILSKRGDKTGIKMPPRDLNLCPREDSNSDYNLRKVAFYPLNYKGARTPRFPSLNLPLDYYKSTTYLIFISCFSLLRNFATNLFLENRLYHELFYMNAVPFY